MFNILTHISVLLVCVVGLGRCQCHRMTEAVFTVLADEHLSADGTIFCNHSEILNQLMTSSQLTLNELKLQCVV